MVNLMLYDNMLSGTVPTNLENLTDLYQVNLSYNQLSGVFLQEYVMLIFIV